MQKQRRQILFALLSLPFWQVAQGRDGLPKGVQVYLVPLDDFPENLAEFLARFLQERSDARIQSSARLPPLRVSRVPERDQLIAEEILARGAKASARLPGANTATYRVFLTTRDINARSGRPRFLLASHDLERKCSVISAARLAEYVDNHLEFSTLTVFRLVKLLRRGIGEVLYGWHRTSNPYDIMYAPLTSVDELDRMGFNHAEDSEEPDTDEPPLKSSDNFI